MNRLQVRPAAARRGGDELTAFRLPFVAEVCALLLGGPFAMTATALLGIAARWTAGFMGRVTAVPMVLHAGSVVAGTQVSGHIYALLEGPARRAGWPWPALAAAVAVVAYGFVMAVSADTLAALVTRRAMPRFRLDRALRGWPWHVLAGSVAVALVAVVEHRAWALLPVVGLPAAAAWWLSHAHHTPAPTRERATLDAPDVALAATDADGCVVSWNAKAVEFFECPAHTAIGLPLEQAASGLPPEVVRAVADVARTRSVRALPRVRARGAARTIECTVIPDGDGAVLIGRDVSHAVDVEHVLEELTERFDLVSVGANDGLWFLNQRTRALHVTARWKTMLGLPGVEATIPIAEWFDRVHPEDLPGLRSAIESHLAGRTGCIEYEHRVRHEDGSYRRMLCRGIGKDASTRRAVRLAGSLTDVTETASAREHMLRAGMRDPLTGLANRSAFVEELGTRLTDLRQRRGGRFAVLYLDLDRFKVVNDSLGHLVGDELLVAVSRRLEACLRPGDTIARLGGDEFAILLHGLQDGTQANVVAFRIQEALLAPFSIGDREVVTSVSIGIAFSRNEYTNPEEIMRDADTAMYHAKAHGKARHEFFDADMHAREQDRLGIETDLRHAVQTAGFEVHYQPIVSLSSRMCVGFEALVRWKRQGRAVSPADFIPMAEELGLIEPLGTWVLRQSCRQLAEWLGRYPSAGIEYVSVNVSTRQLMQQGFAYLVERTVAETGLRPAQLRLEITETAIMDAPRSAAKVLEELRASGVQIYLDDFGTGYSSLSHLHKLPVDALKIDRSFVSGILLDDRPAIVESILALARTLDTSVIAEGVEHETQARELERLGCGHAQGFYFSRPVPHLAVEELLKSPKPLGSYPYVARAAAAS